MRRREVVQRVERLEHTDSTEPPTRPELREPDQRVQQPMVRASRLSRSDVRVRARSVDCFEIDATRDGAGQRSDVQRTSGPGTDAFRCRRFHCLRS
jgi:hypothetical protein